MMALKDIRLDKHVKEKRKRGKDQRLNDEHSDLQSRGVRRK